MGMTDGMVAMGAYTGSPSANITALQSLIGDPDEVRSDGRNAGSNLDEMSPVARAQLAVELDAIAAGSQVGGKDAAYGSHVVTSAEDTANQADIVTGLADIVLASSAVSIVRGGSVILSDQVVTEPTPGTIRVANGGTTYVLTAGDVINWLAVSA